jgi:hypothetical protein
VKKQQVLGKLELAWQDLGASFRGLPETVMEQPGVMGAWSVKDILAHVTTWEEEALHHLPTILLGRRPPRYKDRWGGIDAFNHQMAEQKRQLSLAEVLQQFDRTHRQLVAYVEGAPGEEFTTETRFRRRLRLDTYSHYPLHTRAIVEWRERSDGRDRRLPAGAASIPAA